MAITQRQSQILNRIIQEYINLAQPISSQFIEKKYNFGICPATIRIEMQKLTDEGYLYQPHTSAGRIPTDKGYRFFVDTLLEKELENCKIEYWFKKDYKAFISYIHSLLRSEWVFGIEGTIKFIQSLTKKLASFSQAFVISYLKNEKVFWKEGWEELLKEPEFKKESYIINFSEFLENFERGIENFSINSEIKIYIGRECPFKKSKDFSIISSKCSLPKNKETIIFLLGPKRMTYGKNISLINSLTKILSKL